MEPRVVRVSGDRDEARANVLEWLVAASVEFDAIAHAYADAGMFDEAEVAHDCAVRVNEAYVAESEDPRPVEPTVHCLNCAAAYARGSR